MRIIVWGINYAPEVTGIAPCNAGLCEYLQAAGDDVRMLTTFAYYPQWRKSAGDRGRLYRTDLVNGVTVHRCWHYVPARVTSLRRIWHEFTFGLTSALRALTLPRADVYVVVSPPLVLGAFAWLVTRLRRSRYVFHVQDLQPDAAAGLGMVKPGRFLRMLYRLERFAYRRAVLVSGISAGMMKAFARKGLPAAQTYYFPNWSHAAEPVAAPPGAGTRVRARHGVGEHDFVAFYSGNLGRKQGLEVLIETAALLAERPASVRPITLFVAGDGAARAELAAAVAARGLRNLLLRPLLDDADYRAMLATADLCLITQAAGTGQFFFPSKLLRVLEAGRPVLAVADADSELATAVTEGGFGRVLPPQNAAALADELVRLEAAPEVLAGWAARTSWVQVFAAPTVLGGYRRELEKLAAQKI